MQKMLKVKQSNELQQEIESYKMKETLLENSMQPLVIEALELSTVADSQLKVLKEYDAFAQEKAIEASSVALQELVEKEQAVDDIMCGLNKQFTIFSNKVCSSEEQQSVPGRDTGESQGHVGAQTLKVLNVGNSTVLV